jgi:HlyD family secretion protein
MIKFLVVAPVAVFAGCGASNGDPPADERQGVVELTEWTLGFEVAGRVASVPAAAGDVLESGGVIARLDPTLEALNEQARKSELDMARSQADLLRAGARTEDVRALQAQLSAARSREELLERNLTRQRALSESGASSTALLDQTEAQLAQASAERAAASERLRALRGGARTQELDAAEARVRLAETALSVAEERLRRHTLVSATAATVLEVHVEPGEVVGPGTPIVTLADTTRPFVDVFVPQAEIASVIVGHSADVRVDGLARSLTGRVEHVARHTEFTPRYLFSERERPNLVVRVRIRVEDPEGRLHAGQPAFAVIHHGPAPRRAPAQTVARGGGHD